MSFGKLGTLSSQGDFIVQFGASVGGQWFFFPMSYALTTEKVGHVWPHSHFRVGSLGRIQRGLGNRHDTALERASFVCLPNMSLFFLFLLFFSLENLRYERRLSSDEPHMEHKLGGLACLVVECSYEIYCRDHVS